MSAAILQEHIKDKDSVIFIPLNHGTSVKEAINKYLPPEGQNFKEISKIWFLDIAPKWDDLMHLQSLRQEKQVYTEVVIIDHHKTAVNAISKFIGKPIEEDKPIALEYDFITFIYDPTESGASLTYKTLIDKNLPMIVDIVKDKDIWLWRYQNTDEVNDFLYMYTDKPDLMREFLHKDIEEIAAKSKILSEYKNFMVNKLKETWSNSPLYININDIKVPAINTPVYQSEIGSLIAKEHNIACMFYITGDFVKLSFRSVDGSARKIAESLGGGGHDNAAGAIIDKEMFFKSLIN
jgi:Predicted phosphohydrolase (DHH superfamily)